MAISITASELTAGLKALESFPAAQVAAAIGARLANLPADAVLAEDFAGELNDAGVPYAEDAVLIIKTVAWIAENSKTTNGGVIGAFADSLAGIKRPVANADGSDLAQ